MNQRPIKFMAWHTPTKRLFRVYGFDTYRIFEADSDGFSTVADPVKRSDCHLLQFTGITDKNGKEIYEGHIIESTFEDLGVVKGQSFEYNAIGFINGAFGLVSKYHANELETFYNLEILSTLPDAVIVGNIFENYTLIAPEHQDEEEFDR
ncbi:YopX family protein [Spirosoma pollinicola]|uniref:YopX protein domain-containing protein n=1 Tax=Spirosoma pollinicola TaxID=2057025 RepID=A0A2K8YTT4_9BACT|nr:YopX family protein [Spirosoma pollinicola]AUD00968.1 hypothetical protein CWM47_03525 [Spirosoma pollinicola]